MRLLDLQDYQIAMTGTYGNTSYGVLNCLKPSLSMKILSINNFTTKLHSKLLSDLYIGVHLKGSTKFGSKVNNRQ